MHNVGFLVLPKCLAVQIPHCLHLIWPFFPNFHRHLFAHQIRSEPVGYLLLDLLLGNRRAFATEHVFLDLARCGFRKFGDKLEMVWRFEVGQMTAGKIA